MIGFTARAARQLKDLRQHYENRERPEALRALIAAVHDATQIIEATPESGLPAPRPYPQLARHGRAWIKSGRYWIGYQTSRPPIIIAVFYDAANIPGRI